MKNAACICETSVCRAGASRQRVKTYPKLKLLYSTQFLFEEKNSQLCKMQAGLLVIILLVKSPRWLFQHLPEEGSWKGSDKVMDGRCAETSPERGEETAETERDRHPPGLKPEELWCRALAWDGTKFQTPGVLPPLSSSSHFRLGEEEKKLEWRERRGWAEEGERRSKWKPDT